MGIEPAQSVSVFFREVLLEALEAAQVEPSESTEYYLVNLLSEFVKARITDEPLSMLLAQSRLADPAERIRSLKQVGDTSLYMSGFFADSFEGTLIDSAYYIGLGETAYRELAVCLAGSRSAGEIYEELAANFPRFVDVLAVVRSQVSFVGTDVIALYREWTRTKSDWIERRLRSMGMLVTGGDGYVQ